MGILHDLHQHCESLLQRGHKTVSAEYVKSMVEQHMLKTSVDTHLFVKPHQSHCEDIETIKSPE